MSSRPKVSVITITYQHSKFIEQTLKSIVEQKTDFDFEVIVADDNSKDSTKDIIRQYASQYPEIIKPILRPKNIGAQNNFKDAILQAQGEYIALCEGDDYWTDTSKLQQEVDYLDSHPGHALVFHPVQVVHENDEMQDYIYPVLQSKNNFSIERLLKENFIQTNSVMYRKQRYDDLPVDVLPLDWYLHLYHAQYGRIGFINKVMAAYRKHPDSLWASIRGNEKMFWKKHGAIHLVFYARILKLYDKKHEQKDIVESNILATVRAIYSNVSDADSVVRLAVEQVPDLAITLIHKIEQELSVAQQENVQINQSIRELHRSIEQLNNEIALIKSSRFWKLRNLVASIIGKEKV